MSSLEIASSPPGMDSGRGRPPTTTAMFEAVMRSYTTAAHSTQHTPGTFNERSLTQAAKEGEEKYLYTIGGEPISSQHNRIS